jgi:cytochrome P450
VQYDPFEPATIADPFGAYRRLRDEAPAYRTDRGFWVISRYDDVVRALRDHERFSSSAGVGSEWRPVPMMISVDPPDHTRLRRLVQREFTPRAIASWDERVTRIVDETLDAFIERGGGDLAVEVAYPIPIGVIADMLDVPAEHRADFKRWSDDTIDALGGGLDPATSTRVELSIIEFAQYFAEVIARRRLAPGRDLLSLLVDPANGETLADGDLISFAILLLVAGNETTTNLIGNLVHALATNPDQWTRLQRDRTLVPAAVEEALRFDAPIQGFFRNTVVDVELHGETIPADEKVMVLFGSANRDERKYPEPDRFIVDRNPMDHLAFGAGIHLCLGAPLARLEGTRFLERMLDRVERVEPAGVPERTENPLLRGVRHLPVTLVPR